MVATYTVHINGNSNINMTNICVRVRACVYVVVSGYSCERA